MKLDKTGTVRTKDFFFFKENLNTLNVRWINVVLLKCKYFCPINLYISDKFFNFVCVYLHVVCTSMLCVPACCECVYLRVSLQMIYLTFINSKKKGKDYNFEKAHKMCFEQVDHFSPPTYI